MQYAEIICIPIKETDLQFSSEPYTNWPLMVPNNQVKIKSNYCRRAGRSQWQLYACIKMYLYNCYIINMQQTLLRYLYL